MDILKNILKAPHPGKIFLIIDGLDECDSAYSKELLQLLQWMLQASGPDSVRLANVARFLVLSRPSRDIDGWCSSSLHIEVTADEVADDVNAFVDADIKRIGTFKDFDSFSLDEVALIIKLLASDSFLWVYNILKNLEQLGDTQSTSIMTLVTTCPRDMEAYFHQALRDISSGDKLFPTIQNIILFVRRPLQVSELQEAVGLTVNKDLSHFDLSGRIRSAYTKLLRINASGEVIFVHHSLRELLARTTAEAEGHLFMSGLCLKICSKKKFTHLWQWTTRKSPN